MNNVVIMQTKQLGRIETLEEELHSAKGHVQDLEQKLVEQDCVITNLVGDNLNHLQDNMHLTMHINSSSACLAQLEEWMGQVGMLVYGMARGMVEGLSTEGSSLEAGTLGTSGDDHTGGKGSIIQWVHVEYIEGSEIICPTFTQWVRGGYFSKVPTKVPTG